MKSSIPRREFLKQAGMAGVATALGSPALSALADSRSVMLPFENGERIWWRFRRSAR